MSILVSVIVPVYNTEAYLERCINSILAQSYEDFELILVDDGSTDRSGAILDEFSKTDQRIKVIHKQNGGSSSARNEALKVAKGDYISFIDSDDYVEEDFLKRLVYPVTDAMDNENYIPMIVQIGRNEIDEEENIMPDICVPPEREVFIRSKEFFNDLIMHVGDCSFCTKLTARKLFANREFPVGKLNEDFHLLIQMLMETEGVYSLPGYGYHVFYRLGSNSRKKDKNDFSRVFKDNIENADMVEQLVAEKFPELSEVAVRFGLFQRMDYMLHIPIACMRKDYEGYSEVVKYIRKHWPSLLGNKYLTSKNKVYLTLFALCPKFSRVIHAKLRHI